LLKSFNDDLSANYSIVVIAGLCWTLHYTTRVDKGVSIDAQV